MKRAPSARAGRASAALLDVPRPRYAVVAHSLMREIEAGRFPVGARLPTELELCDRFGISRFTAREAMRRLADAGLVTKRAGVGSIVKASAASARYSASVSDLSELFAFNRRARLEPLGRDHARIGADLAEVLPHAVGQRWPRFRGRRFLDGMRDPMVYTEILVHPAHEGVLDQVGEPGVMVYELLERATGGQIAEMRQVLESIATPAAIARALGTRAGAPALRVLRCYVGRDDEALSLSINVHVQHFKMTTRWRLDRAAA